MVPEPLREDRSEDVGMDGVLGVEVDPVLVDVEGARGWEELEALKMKVLRGGRVDPVLRAWSQGSVGDKTFQEIAEQFAELIIPKVWEREGKKVSRVSTRLSMSPKKVRRILGRVGRRKPRAD